MSGWKVEGLCVSCQLCERACCRSEVKLDGAGLVIMSCRVVVLCLCLVRAGRGRRVCDVILNMYLSIVYKMLAFVMFVFTDEWIERETDLIHVSTLVPT